MLALCSIILLAIAAGLLIATPWILKSYETGKNPGKEALVGLQGRALENFSSAGTIMIQGEIWKAQAAQGLVAKDDTVVVTGVLDGLTLEVAAVPSTEKSSP